jgi:4'-phosphopantetheinyl transferase
MINWKPPENNINLPENETQVWLLPLELTSEQINSLKSFLSDDELARADRFYFDQHRNHYIAARGLMRKILNNYLKTEDKKLVFVYNEFGKPYLEDNSLHFNLSHSHELAILAINLKYELGVDIEWMHRKTNLLQIAERFFSANEFAELISLPAEFQRQGFFNCWTRKESYIKARGEGLGIPLSQFEVSLKSEEPALLKSTAHDPVAVKSWTLYAFDPHPDYAAALTLNSLNTELIFQDGSFFI